jgi:hypothetical protein
MPFGTDAHDLKNLNKYAMEHYEDRKKSYAVNRYSKPIDPKRQVNKKQKEQIFNEAKTHDLLDPDHIRLDMMGNVVVKDIPYNRNPNEHQRKLALEYEHILPHAEGGRTNERNIGLLNAGVNRCKGKHGFKDLSSENIIDLGKKKCISPESFIKEFKNLGVDHVVNKYDLPFYTNENGVIGLKKK